MTGETGGRAGWTRAGWWGVAVVMAGLLSCEKPAGPSDGAVARIDIEPATPIVGAGAEVTLVARSFDAAGTELPPQPVFWSSEKETIATVSQAGIVSGVAPGTAQIAASADGVSGIATVTVQARVTPVAQVRVTPTTSNILPGDNAQLTAATLDAAGTLLPGRSVMWSSSNQSVAIVSSTGLVHGVSPGTVTITATSEGRSGTAQVNIAAPPAPAAVGSVVLAISPDSVMTGATLSGTATVRDGSSNPLSGRTVTLTSSATNVATVGPASGTSDGSGRVSFTVTGLAAGTARITATSGGRSATFDVRVLAAVAAVSITPALRNVDRGKTTTLTVTARSSSGAALAGRVCSISSAGPTIASVSPSTGTTNGNGEIRVTVTGLKTGVVTISATCEGKTATAVVTVLN